jgi:hypothetical protein
MVCGKLEIIRRIMEREQTNPNCLSLSIVILLLRQF